MEGGSLERRVVSVLFADLVGFTSLSEELDAEDVAAIQERYFATVRGVIERHGGKLEKFIGDAAMAVFGVPRTRDDDAERATRAGLALLNAIDGLSSAIGLADGTLRLRVGVTSGEVAYTPAGGDEWRVSGDVVNVAARLQAAAEPGTVLVGEGTAFAVADAIALDPPARLELKGKAESVEAWRAVTPLPHRSRERAMGSLRAPFVGRESDVAQLVAMLDRVRAGASETVIVVAPPGVGKSRLTGEFARLATDPDAARPAVVRRARLGPESISPSAAVTQLVASAPPAAGMTLSSALAQLLEEDRVEAGAAQIPVADLARERQLLFDTWIGGLDELAGGRPQVWLIEDIHWAGGDLLAFIEQAAARPTPGGRLILGTARPSLHEQLAARPPGPTALPLLDLPPLDGTATHELISALVADALPQRLVEAIVARADGNPLFVEELLRSWASVGTLVAGDDERWTLTREVHEVALPQTIQAIYSGQLDDLPTNARMLVRRGSVAGREIPRNSLAALNIDDPEPALEAALRRSLLREVPPDVIVGPAVHYRHVLLRDAGYASLSRAERAQLHARMAAWYERAAGPRADEVAEVIARHYGAAVRHASRLAASVADGLERGTAVRRAIEWYERAAQRALAGAAHETARELLVEALEHADEADDALRGRLLLRLGEATAYSADMDAGEQLLTRALEHYRRAGPGAGYAEAAAALGRVWAQQIRFDDALRLADETLAAVGDPQSTGVARLLGLRAWLRATLRQEKSAIADLERGLQTARDAGDRRLELELLDWRAMTLGELDLVKQVDWQVVQDLALDLGDWSRAVKSMRVSASWLIDDRAAEVWALADRAEEICRRRGLEEDLTWIEYVRSEAGFVSGEWDRALAAGMHAIEIAERNAYHRAAVRTWHVVLPIAEARGDTDLVKHAFRWFEARRPSLPDSRYARMMNWVFESRFIRAGLRPPSVPDLTELLPSFDSEPGSPSWLSAIEDVLELWLSAGRLDDVRAALDRSQRTLSASHEPTSLGRGCMAYLSARLAASGSVGSAEVEDLARTALGLFRDTRAPWWTAKALRVLADGGLATEREANELAEIHAALGVAR